MTPEEQTQESDLSNLQANRLIEVGDHIANEVFEKFRIDNGRITTLTVPEDLSKVGDLIRSYSECQDWYQRHQVVHSLARSIIVKAIDGELKAQVGFGRLFGDLSDEDKSTLIEGLFSKSNAIQTRHELETRTSQLNSLVESKTITENYESLSEDMEEVDSLLREMEACAQEEVHPLLTDISDAMFLNGISSLWIPSTSPFASNGRSSDLRLRIPAVIGSFDVRREVKK